MAAEKDAGGSHAATDADEDDDNACFCCWLVLPSRAAVATTTAGPVRGGEGAAPRHPSVKSESGGGSCGVVPGGSTSWDTRTKGCGITPVYCGCFSANMPMERDTCDIVGDIEDNTGEGKG